MPETDIGEMWDAGEVNRITAVVEGGLPGYIATYQWFDLSEPTRRKLEKVISRMLREIGGNI